MLGPDPHTLSTRFVDLNPGHIRTGPVSRLGIWVRMGSDRGQTVTFLDIAAVGWLVRQDTTRPCPDVCSEALEASADGACTWVFSQRHTRRPRVQVKLQESRLPELQ